MKRHALPLIAGAAGGLLGYVLFFWIVRQGFYALVLPGALVGIGASLVRTRSQIVCVICGVMALAAGIVAEWKFAPFRKDGSLSYFLLHLQDLRPLTLIMIGIGTAMGYWLPFRGK
jgi:hypothetical protein